MTSPKKLTYKEAAIEAVKAIGLNQIQDVKMQWFADKKQWEMFESRRDRLKTVL